MNNLIYEQVNDVNVTYPYLCVYKNKNDLNPFMDISLTDDKKIQFLFYPNNENTFLSFEDFSEIQRKSIEFLEMIIDNEANNEKSKL